MNREKLLRKIQKETYCRIQPSSTHHGVGVFAIKDIQRGVKPFGDLSAFHEEEQKFTHEEIDGLELEKSLHEYVYQMHLSDDKYLYIENDTLNHLPIHYFVNHSSYSNLEWINVIDDYFITKEVKAGEELFLDYIKYAKDLKITPPSFIKDIN